MDLAARDGLTPIYRAAMAGEAKVVRMLDQLGADLDSACKAGNRPLHAACFGGHTQAVRQLLAAGVSPGEENRAGLTPLLLACQQGHADIARVLCDHDAELARPTSECSPLYAAAEHGHAGVARLLLGLAAAEAPSWRGNGGLAPLHAVRRPATCYDSEYHTNAWFSRAAARLCIEWRRRVWRGTKGSSRCSATTLT